MDVVLLQTDIAWGDPQANLYQAQALVDAHPGADIYVLPEMFTTGFVTGAGDSLDRGPERTIAWMRSVALKGDCAVAGSVAMRDEFGRPVNRMFFVTADRVASYDKKHLFTYSGEHERFAPGNERVVVEFRGMRILLLVCYDLRFPVWARNRGDYDAIMVVASWPVQRQDAWETLAKARAIENQCYVMAVNRAGKDPSCTYLGGSALYDPLGKIICRCEDGIQSVARGVMDMKVLEELRSAFPVLSDADGFTLL